MLQDCELLRYCPQTTRKSLLGDGCSSAVQGECLLTGVMAAATSGTYATLGIYTRHKTSCSYE
jgi:hypothetical protein